MEGLAHAVARVVAHHPVVEALGVFLDHSADDIDFATGPHRSDPALHRSARALDERSRPSVDLADRVGRVRVAVDAVEIGGDVQVDEVALLEDGRVGDAVADDLVDRGADRFGEAHVAQAGRVGAVVAHVLVGYTVELVGGDTGGDDGGGLGHSAGGHPAGGADAFDGLRILDVGGRHPFGTVVEHVLGTVDGIGHVAAGAQGPRHERAARSTVGKIHRVSIGAHSPHRS